MMVKSLDSIKQYKIEFTGLVVLAVLLGLDVYPGRAG
jgi:hypothetical protein